MAPSNQHEDMEGVEMAGEAHRNNHPLLTELEKRVLELYDRSEMLRQEIAELKALGVLSKGQPQQASEDGIKKASEELLEAKAKYSLRSNIIESTLVANPILNAVHAGVNATVVEQDLLPLVEQRDSLSVSLTEMTSKVQSTREELIKTESEHIITARRNVELATTMIALAKEADTQKKDDIVDVKARQQIDELEKAMKASRQRWRIMKGTASAIVAGSGIDWARNPKLLEIVLDKDGEEEG